MDEKDLRFHMLLQEEMKSKEKKEVKLSRVLTIVSAIIFLAVGTYFMMTFNPSINAYLVKEKSANYCAFSGQSAAYTGPSLGCEYTGYSGGAANINITNNFFQDKGLKVNSLSINTCTTNVNSTISKGKSKEIKVYCGDLKLSNKIALDYTDLYSGISHRIDGTLTIISK